MRFTNNVAFITGGAAGFGLAFAHALHAEGAAVVLADINIEAAECAASALREQGARALAVLCDVSDASAVTQAVAEAVAHFGAIDLLINNAGRHLTKYNRPFSRANPGRAARAVRCERHGHD